MVASTRRPLAEFPTSLTAAARLAFVTRRQDDLGIQLVGRFSSGESDARGSSDNDHTFTFERHIPSFGRLQSAIVRFRASGCQSGRKCV